MAVFFLLLAVLVGVVLGDALVENESTGAITLFGQNIDQFTDGQLLLGFAGLGILFALLLVLSLSSTRRRRARRKERRTAGRELEDQVTQLERDNARLRTDLSQRDEALAGREAELAHRDRLLASRDEELALHGVVAGSALEAAPDEAAPPEAAAPEEEVVARRLDDLPNREEELGDGGRRRRSDEVDQLAPDGTAVLDHASSGSPEASDRSMPEETAAANPPEATEVLAPHDEPPVQSTRAGDRARPVSDSDAAGASQAEADSPTEQVAPGESRAEGGPVDRRTWPDRAVEQDSDRVAEDERTRPLQRPDRNS
jgi:hypothetical protein